MKKQSLFLVAGLALMTSACANLCETDCGMEPCTSGEVMFVSSPAMFGFDSAKLTAKDADALATTAKRLKADADATVTANGYASLEGPASYNVDLSKRRAETVKKYLVEKGVAADRIAVKGHGATDAFGSNYADNRRVEVVVD